MDATSTTARASDVNTCPGARSSRYAGFTSLLLSISLAREPRRDDHEVERRRPGGILRALPTRARLFFSIACPPCKPWHGPRPPRPRRDERMPVRHSRCRVAVARGSRYNDNDNNNQRPRIDDGRMSKASALDAGGNRCSRDARCLLPPLPHCWPGRARHRHRNGRSVRSASSCRSVPAAAPTSSAASSRSRCRKSSASRS